MDPEGRRLLQRVQQEAEGLSVVRFDGRPGLTLPGPVRLVAKSCTKSKDDCRVRVVDFTRPGMEKIGWKITAAVALVVFSQAASAALDSRAAVAAGNSTYQNVSQADGPGNGARPASVDLLAQAEAPAASAPSAVPATTPPADSTRPHDQSPPAISSPPNPTSKAVVMKAGPTVVGCGLK
jgi:hypothetical protein